MSHPRPFARRVGLLAAPALGLAGATGGIAAYLSSQVVGVRRQRHYHHRLVAIEGDRVVLRLGEAGQVDGGAVAALGQRYPGRLVQMPRVPELGFRLDPRGREDVLDVAESVLSTLLGAASASA